MKDSSFYDAEYFGVKGENTKSNYRLYTKTNKPGWCAPLAELLTNLCEPNFIDLGCAYGHLVAAINARLGFNLHFNLYGEHWRAQEHAVGVDWSPWAAREDNRASSMTVRQDVRAINPESPYLKAGFRTIISMDLLEHLSEREVHDLVNKMMIMLGTGGTMVHLIGASDEDVRHYDDSSHATHRPMEWWDSLFTGRGLRREPFLQRALRTNIHWSTTDWSKRWLAYTK